MGTSKGYISPTRVPWSNAKRAVGEMIKEPSAENISKVASKFATAMKSDITSKNYSDTFNSAVAGILGFIQSAASSGVDNTLRGMGFEELIGKSSNEIWDELLYFYTNDGKTDEDALALDALSLTTKNLELNIEKLEEIDSAILLKEMIVNYICLKFEFHYEEKIGKRISPSQKGQILEKMKKYIRANVYEGLTFESIRSIDFQKLNGNQYVKDSLWDAFSTLEDIYLGD